MWNGKTEKSFGRRRCVLLRRQEAGRRSAIGIVLHDVGRPPLRVEPHLADAGAVRDALGLPAAGAIPRTQPESHIVAQDVGWAGFPPTRSSGRCGFAIALIAGERVDGNQSTGLISPAHLTSLIIIHKKKRRIERRFHFNIRKLRCCSPPALAPPPPRSARGSMRRCLSHPGRPRPARRPGRPGR